MLPGDIRTSCVPGSQRSFDSEPGLIFCFEKSGGQRCGISTDPAKKKEEPRLQQPPYHITVPLGEGNNQCGVEEYFANSYAFQLWATSSRPPGRIKSRSCFSVIAYTTHNNAYLKKYQERSLSTPCTIRRSFHVSMAGYRPPIVGSKKLQDTSLLLALVTLMTVAWTSCSKSFNLSSFVDSFSN